MQAGGRHIQQDPTGPVLQLAGRSMGFQPAAAAARCRAGGRGHDTWDRHTVFPTRIPRIVDRCKHPRGRLPEWSKIAISPRPENCYLFLIGRGTGPSHLQPGQRASGSQATEQPSQEFSTAAVRYEPGVASTSAGLCFVSGQSGRNPGLQTLFFNQDRLQIYRPTTKETLLAPGRCCRRRLASLPAARTRGASYEYVRVWRPVPLQSGGGLSRGRAMRSRSSQDRSRMDKPPEEGEGRGRVESSRVESEPRTPRPSWA